MRSSITLASYKEPYVTYVTTVNVSSRANEQSSHHWAPVVVV